MQKLEISKSIVYYNSHKFKAWGDLRKFINSWKLFALVIKIERATDAWNIIVLWWDWTLLKAIKDSYWENKPVLWVNFWTKWFLLHSLKDIDNNFEFEELEYPLLDCEVKVWEKVLHQIAFNEIDFRANTGKIIDLDISLDNNLKTNLKWDGFVFSTPAWSTGYNFSLWWPILPHSVNSFVLTPKAPWLPRCFKSVMINDEKTVIIKNVWRLSDIKIVCDWTDFFETKDEEIIVTIKKAEKGITLLVPKDLKIPWEDKIFLEQGFE